MGVFRATVSLSVGATKSGLQCNRNLSAKPLLLCTPMGAVNFDRGAHTQDITKNIQYISNDKIKLVADPKTLKLDKPQNKPLCVMINWLLARQKHIMKYATLYLEQGFDVVSVSCTPWQLMWPLKGTQLIAKDLLQLLANNDSYNPLVVHGFSVGGYLWGELLVHSLKDKKRYQPIKDRIAAQIWDSMADVSEISTGVPVAVFPHNKIMQKTLKAYMEYHLKTFEEAATRHYVLSSQTFHTEPSHAPALLLLSRSDPVGTETNNKHLHDVWTHMGIKCTWKCWDKSPHVQHYMVHQKEYLTALYEHLDTNGLISQPDKMRMRL